MRSRRLEILVVLALIAFLGYLSYQITSEKNPEVKKQVSVILPGSQNDRWKVMRAGMEQAADVYGIEIRYATLQEYISNNDIWSRALEEKRNGADAIVVSPITVPDSNQGKNADLSTIPIIILGSDVVVDGICRNVSADDYQIGYTIGEALWEEYGETLGEMKIGLVTGEIIQASMQKRRDGFMDALDSHGVGIAWNLGLGRRLKATLMSQLQNESTQTDVIVALGNVETETAIDCVLEVGEDIPIYGEGYSEKAVYYLDKGTVDCLTLSNDFSIGFRSIEMVAEELLVTKKKSSKDAYTIYCVRGNELYTEENQKILFPLVQ